LRLYYYYTKQVIADSWSVQARSQTPEHKKWLATQLSSALPAESVLHIYQQHGRRSTLVLDVIPYITIHSACKA